MPLRRPTTGPQLSPRDWAILKHVQRDHLTIYPVLNECFFHGQGPTAALKVAHRLCRAGFLRRAGLLRRQVCFVLTPHTAKLLGASTKRASFPGPQSLPIDFALLLYTSAAYALRKRLTRSELLGSYPWMTPALAALPHCLDQSQAASPCLELVRVDLGGKADHVARKCRADIGCRQTHDDFRKLLRAGQFRLVVITTTESKRDLIRQALDRHDWPRELAIHLVALPSLASFL